MKKIIMLLCLVLIVTVTSLFDIYAKDDLYHEIEEFMIAYSTLEETWSDAKLIRGESIYGIDDQEVGYIYRIYKGKQQNGYILYLYEFGICEATFEGFDPVRDINGKAYYIMPGRFMTKREFYDEIKAYDISSESETEEIDSLIISSVGRKYYGTPSEPDDIYYSIKFYYVNTSHVPDLSSNVEIYTSQYSYKKWIEDVPDYNSSLIQANGCGPTAAANVIAYYDNEEDNDFSVLEGPYSWNKFEMYTGIDEIELGREIGLYANTCLPIAYEIDDYSDCWGVTPGQLSLALNDYLDDMGLGQYQMVTDTFSSDADEYRKLIDLGNPSTIYIYGHATYGNHGVTGVGYYIVNGAAPGVVVHDNWSSTAKQIWLSYGVLTYFQFIYDN